MNTSSHPPLLSLLPKAVHTIHDAEAVLLALAQCDKMHHFDDDPHQVACFSPEEADAVDALMEQMDEVTRKHYGMTDATECNAAIWDGLVKDVTCGFLVFGADDSGSKLYVYDHSHRVSTTTLQEWEQLKASATEDDGESYDEGVLEEWFAGRGNGDRL
jgi:hypothetical protein